MPSKSVALLTMSALPELDPDDGALVAALAARGTRGVPVVWDAPGAADAYALAIVRSTWDYTERADEFLTTLERVEATVLNPPHVLRWNAHKGYLLELQAKGVDVVPTALLARGARRSLREVATADDVVVKPAISAGARRTFRLSVADEGAQAVLDGLLAEGDVLVQPTLPSIVDDGEWSLVFFERAFSHCVVKRPQAGDFRVQEQHGGVFAAATPPPAAMRAADQVLAAVGEDLLYARVDLARGRDGRYLLMELEVVEPSLYFAHGPGAAERFADAIVRRLAAT